MGSWNWGRDALLQSGLRDVLLVGAVPLDRAQHLHLALRGIVCVCKLQVPPIPVSLRTNIYSFTRTKMLMKRADHAKPINMSTSSKHLG